MKFKMKEISVVIPVFNGAGNLAELHRQLVDALKEVSCETIFVDDCSDDNSWKVIKELSQKDKKVIGISLRKNSGQDNAIMAGLSHANGDYVVIMDDDLQHSPYDIPVIYEQCRQGFDVCYANYREKKQKLWKNTGSRVNGLFARFLLKKPKALYLSPFKIIKLDVVKEMLKYNGPFPYIDGLILQLTHRITSVNVSHYERFEGKGNYTFFRSISLFLKVLTTFSVIPLRLAFITGFITSGIGFLLAIYYMIEYFFNKHRVEGWASLILSFLIIGGLMLMFLGLIGEYIGRIFLTMNKKPPYSIREIINGEADDL